MTSDDKSFGMQLREAAAGGAVNTIVGQLGSMIFGGAQDRRQLKQQRKLQDLQIEGNKQMIDYSNAAQEALQMSMWDKTNYSAQIEQMKKAGLSPSMIYGGSGTGGATVGGGGASGGVSGTNAGDPNAGVEMGLQMASQLALQKAQTENIKADTAVKLASEGLTKEDLEKRKMDTLTQKEVWTKTIAESQEANRGLEDRLKTIKAEAIGSEIENEAKRIGIKVDKQQIIKMAADVAQGWENLKQGEQKIAIDRFKSEIEANYPGIGQVGARVLDDMIEKLFNLGGGRQTMKNNNYIK